MHHFYVGFFGAFGFVLGVYRAYKVEKLPRLRV